MNVSQLIKQLGTSKPTFYKRVKSAGIDLDALRDSITGELSSEGVATISALFDTTTSSKELNAKSANLTPSADVLQVKVDALERENDMLRSILADKDAEIKRLSADLEAWRAKAQEVNVKQLLLTMSETMPQRRGLREWLRGLAKHDTKKEGV